MNFVKYFFLLVLFHSEMIFAEIVDVMLAPTDTPATISFTEALNLALTNNVVLKKTEQAIIIAESDKLTSMSKHLPQVVTRASHSALHKKDASNVVESANAGVSVTIPLLDAKTLIEVRGKHEAKKMAQDKYRFEQESLIHTVGNLYIEALIARATKENAFLEYEHYQKQLSVLEKKIEAGNARPLDVTRAQYLASNAHSDYLQKNSELQKRMGELGQKIGVHEHFLLSDVTIDSLHLTKSRDELLAVANLAADVKAAERDVASAEYSLLSEKFEYLPKFSATLDSGYENTYDKGFLSNRWLPTTKMMVTVELPLFTGFSSLAAINSKTAAKTINELTLRDKNREKILSINGVLAELNDLATIKQSALLALDSATKTKESTERLYHIGEATGLELVEAYTNHFSAKNLVITTTLRLEQAKLRLLFLIGKVKEII